MTAPKRLTRKLFWGRWPEVAPGFEWTEGGLLRAGSHCPLSAVAERLGHPVRSSISIEPLDAAIGRRPRPQWARDVIGAADGRGWKAATYRRLVEHIPEGNR